jgi:8-oxo-dGTP pyrophosphatase MutT (NUDIX family)
MNSDTKDSSVVVILEGDGLDSFLTYMTPKGKIFEGRYRLPGGKLKSSEDYSDALSRELQEEYGIGLTNIKLHYQKPNVLGGTIFLCSAKRIGKPSPLESDVGEVEWKSAEEIFKSNMVPNCKIALCAYLLDEHPKLIKELKNIVLEDNELLKVLNLEAQILYQRLNKL